MLFYYRSARGMLRLLGPSGRASSRRIEEEEEEPEEAEGYASEQGLLRSPGPCGSAARGSRHPSVAGGLLSSLLGRLLLL